MKPYLGRRVWWGRRIVRRLHASVLTRRHFSFVKGVIKTMDKGHYPSHARKQFWTDIASGDKVRQKEAIGRLFLARLIGGKH